MIEILILQFMSNWGALCFFLMLLADTFVFFQIGTINISTFSRSFKEWKFCNFELDQLQMKDWMKCPPCTIQQHSAHVDGNMKLYRFKTAGR